VLRALVMFEQRERRAQEGACLVSLRQETPLTDNNQEHGEGEREKREMRERRERDGCVFVLEVCVCVCPRGGKCECVCFRNSTKQNETTHNTNKTGCVAARLRRRGAGLLTRDEWYRWELLHAIVLCGDGGKVSHTTGGERGREQWIRNALGGWRRETKARRRKQGCVPVSVW
jgi:hypothetical protein